ncbi:endonuclease NucS [Peptococcaceae bacterium]|nr:endonuclease NucS [Peptococcaceae bacterium]
MATEIKVWQITNGKLEPIEITMVEAGRKETEDLEKWIKSSLQILGEDILIIGEQVPTKSGSMDFLGIDKSGNLVIVELKRDRLPRDVLTQAIDYASDVSSWDVDKISEICTKYTNQSLEDYLSEKFEEIDLEDLTINKTQRILLVGFSIEESLQRMIEWLSNNYGVSINAVILKYIKTRNGEELIARTVIIPEEIEKERIRKRQFKILMSDEPGKYNEDELKDLLINYLLENRATPRRIREILLPLCLKHNIVSREMIKKELLKRGEAEDDRRAGIILTTISREIGIAKRDYLRQIIQYEKDPSKPWEKENYRLVEDYKGLVKSVLGELNKQKEKE